MGEGTHQQATADHPVGGLTAFARKRSLEYNPSGRTSDATPYLSGLQDGRSLGAARGQLAAGLEGTIASIEVKPAQQFQNRPPQPAVRKLALETRIPESIGLIPVLTCRDGRRDLLDMTVGAGGIFKLQREVELESIKLRRKFLIGVSEGQDENWVRQLFSPSFVDYLADTAPEGCTFELYHGVLAVGTEEEATEATIEALSEVAAKIADRLRTEALEGDGQGGRSWRGADDERLQRAEQQTEDVLAGVTFDGLPETVGAAAGRFAGRVRRMPFVWISSLLMAMLLALVIVGIPVAMLAAFVGFAADGADLPWGTIWAGAGVVFAIATFLITIKVFSGQVVIRTTQLGLEAFIRLYARERGLELVEGRRFHSENVSANLPGVALYALQGTLPGTSKSGALVVAKDQATRKEQFDYSLSAFDGERVIASTPETPVADWSAATLDEFSAAAA